MAELLPTDNFDTALHDVIMERAEALLAAAAKDPAVLGPSPAAEAKLLRRLCARHRGPLSFSVVAGMLRALVAGTQSALKPFQVALYAGTDLLAYWDLARSHFGAAQFLTVSDTPQAVVHAVADGRALMGVLPDLAGDGAAPTWWPHLLTVGPNAPRVVGRLPFVVNPARASDVPTAFVIACMALEPTGDDTALAVAVTAGDVSRGRLQDVLAKAGLTGHVIAVGHEPSAPRRQLNLIALEGFHAAGDQRFHALEKAPQGVVERFELVGAYANPIRCERVP